MNRSARILAMAAKQKPSAQQIQLCKSENKENESENKVNDKYDEERECLYFGLTLPQKKFLENNLILETSTFLFDKNRKCDELNLEVILEHFMIEKDPFHVSDDSDKDPPYFPYESETSDEEIIVMGKQLEKNLIEENDSQIPSTSTKIFSRSTKVTTKQLQRKRNSGKAYKTASGKEIQSRTCKHLQNCRRKCSEKISYEQQKTIFDKYWSQGSYNLRTAFLSGLIDVQGKKSQTLNSKTIKQRNYSCFYFLRVGLQKIHVCKNCFKSTFGETDGIIKTIIQKKSQSSGSTISPDKRGSRTPSNLTPDEKIVEIKDHINSFPAYESHYTRRHTSQRYFHIDLTLIKMYQLYMERVDKPVSMTKFSQVFHTMGIKFKSPKTDICNVCETFATKLRNEKIETIKATILQDQKDHHELADAAYRSKERDKDYCKNDPHLKVFSFDLQQCLPIPYLQTSNAFYKRLLWTYNLTVHDSKTGDAYCYMWHEAEARRGGNEIASCLFKHLNSIESTIKHVILYSDNCVGQNKNSFVASMFLTFMYNNDHHCIQTIDHKFMLPGHSHMECDSDHASIERKKKKTSMKIQEPRDWYQLVRSIGKRFKVHEIMKNEIYEFADVSKTKLTWRKVNEDNDKFNWSTVKWIRFSAEFGKILYKTTYNPHEPFKELNVRRRGINRIDVS